MQIVSCRNLRKKKRESDEGGGKVKKERVTIDQSRLGPDSRFSTQSVCVCGGGGRPKSSV